LQLSDIVFEIDIYFQTVFDLFYDMIDIYDDRKDNAHNDKRGNDGEDGRDAHHGVSSDVVERISYEYFKS
jgi:hypothetical protein